MLVEDLLVAVEPEDLLLTEVLLPSFCLGVILVVLTFLDVADLETSVLVRLLLL